MLEEIVKELVWFVENTSWDKLSKEVEPVNRWDCVNFLIGRFGCVDKTHIDAINQLVREGVIAR